MCPSMLALLPQIDSPESFTLAPQPAGRRFFPHSNIAISGFSLPLNGFQSVQCRRTWWMGNDRKLLLPRVDCGNCWNIGRNCSWRYAATLYGRQERKSCCGIIINTTYPACRGGKWIGVQNTSWMNIFLNRTTFIVNLILISNVPSAWTQFTYPEQPPTIRYTVLPLSFNGQLIANGHNGRHRWWIRHDHDEQERVRPSSLIIWSRVRIETCKKHSYGSSRDSLWSLVKFCVAGAVETS
jgi:hypothetical protein